MNEERDKQAEQIISSLHRHPRVDYQKLLDAPEQLAAFRASLPFFLPFGRASFHGLLPVLDWDHRLPSQFAILRVYAYYSSATMRAGETERIARGEQIASRDVFPEFDVPDFEGLTADEAYEGEVLADGHIEGMRLISSWRREIAPGEAKVAVDTVSAARDFQQLAEEFHDRPEHLGALEAVSWTPPCESNYHDWTIDVWFMTELDNVMGKGRSFLVDMLSQQVVGMREFIIRTT